MIRSILTNAYKIKLFKRLIPSLIKYISKYNKKLINIDHNNRNIYLNLKNPIDREIYLKNAYEKEQINYLIDIIKKEKIKIFYDIGAHTGYYSLEVSNLDDVFIHSVEPIKSNYDHLKLNIESNNIKNIKIYNFALSNENTNKEMWVSDKNKTGGYAIYNNNDEELKKYDLSKNYRTIVKTIKGDDIFKTIGSVIALKIDVERHEKELIDGIKTLLLNNKAVIQIEIFDKRKKEVEELLNSINFIQFYSIGKDYYFKNF